MQNSVSGVSIMGQRDDQEDSKCAFDIQNLLKLNGVDTHVQVVGVFDGHGGTESSNFVAKNLQRVFKRKTK